MSIRPSLKVRRPRLRRRKNLFIDQRKLDRARRILGAGTETEVIDRALDLVGDMAAYQREMDDGLERVLGMGEIEDHFTPGARRR